jgi:carboxyl-terminal processing protease
MIINVRKSLLGVAVISVGLLAFPLVGPAQQDKSSTYRQLELFGDVFERVRADYVESVSDEDLIEAAIQGMLASLDPHSSFLNAKHFQDMQVQTRGEFGGLGIEVTLESGLVKVVSPIDDTPAYRAGIQAGDFITHIDGDAVRGLTLNKAVDKMRGKVGSDITLTIRRSDSDTFDVTLTRDKIRIDSVRSRVEDGAGYVRITSFNEQTKSGLLRAVKKLSEELGDDLTGFILDLRNNPGGLLDQAVEVSDAFLEQGEIVSTRGRTSDNAQRFNATPGDIAGGLPVVVLINSGSASASEIVAGALQDHRRGILLGTRSFGKGSVQTIMPLGRAGAIKLTTQRYFTPSGRSIQAKGIEPDIFVEQVRLEPLRGRNIERHEEDLRGALKNPADGDATSSEESSVAAASAESGQPIDYQLGRAVDLLQGIALYGKRFVN